MRLLLLVAVIAGAWAQAPDSSSENTGLLEQIQQRAIEDLASVPNYVCVDSIERSLLIPTERRFRRLDRVHLELAHVEGADRFSWLGDSSFYRGPRPEWLATAPVLAATRGQSHPDLQKELDQNIVRRPRNVGWPASLAL